MSQTGALFPYNSFTQHNSILKQSPTYSGPKYYGKYRAVVTNNTDPEKAGRVKMQVPSVLGEHETDWAVPCYPFGHVWIPQQGETVWAEFEGGDPDYPIYTGSWYAYNEVPDETGTMGNSSGAKQHMFKTPSGLRIILDDGSEGTEYIDIKDNNGNYIYLDSTHNKITLQAGSATIILDGTTGRVTINGNSF